MKRHISLPVARAQAVRDLVASRRPLSPHTRSHDCDSRIRSECGVRPRQETLREYVAGVEQQQALAGQCRSGGLLAFQDQTTRWFRAQARESGSHSLIGDAIGGEYDRLELRPRAFEAVEGLQECVIDAANREQSGRRWR